MSESEEQKPDGIRWIQVLAGALASVTAALVGATMGVAGTVVGAGLASVITTVGATLYLRPLQRTSESVRTVSAKVVGRSGGATVMVSTEHPDKEPEEGGEGEPAVPGDEVTVKPAGQDDVTAEGDGEPKKRPRRWAVIAATSVAAFVLGMMIVTGIEWLRGESLSGETGTTVGDIVRDRPANPGPADPSTSNTVPSAPTGTTGSTGTTGPTESGTPTPSTQDRPDPSTTSEATATPSVTTTQETPAPAGTPPPSS